MTAARSREPITMHLFSFDTAWQLGADRRRRLLDEFAGFRVRRPRPRPPVDDLPRPPSTGGLPPAA